MTGAPAYLPYTEEIQRKETRISVGSICMQLTQVKISQLVNKMCLQQVCRKSVILEHVHVEFL